jgi:tRNA modification GTPase
MQENRSTIFAVASGGGRAGVAVIRISGPNARKALQVLSGRAPPTPRRAVLASLRDGEGALLDKALVLWFPAPASFTGEDVVELHCHGGRAVLLAVARALAAEPGLRQAEAGEFSRRAFANGKLDLTEAEAIADLVDAETDLQRRQAMRQMEGALGHLYERWRKALLEAQALVEATIDFPDEDLPQGLMAQARAVVQTTVSALEAHLADNRAGEIIRDGVRVVILGEPNAGKSSLFNALVQREAAIVTPIPGTTRDVLEARLDLKGYQVLLFDTAGLRDSADVVEAEGVRRARETGARADLLLLVADATRQPYLPPEFAPLLQDGGRGLLVWNKADLAPPPPGGIAVSAATGVGLEELRSRIGETLDSLYPLGDGVNLTRERHRLALEECRSSLHRFVGAPEAELAAEDLRMAVRSLGRITGRVDVEDMLDVLFSAFCIGK